MKKNNAAAKSVNTLDLTPSWQSLLPALIQLLTEGKEDSVKEVKYELEKMAKAADRWIEYLKSQKQPAPTPQVQDQVTYEVISYTTKRYFELEKGDIYDGFLTQSVAIRCAENILKLGNHYAVRCQSSNREEIATLYRNSPSDLTSTNTEEKEGTDTPPPMQ